MSMASRFCAGAAAAIFMFDGIVYEEEGVVKRAKKRTNITPLSPSIFGK
jgi:hypothetical protein